MVTRTPSRFHPDRATGRHRDHRRADCTVAPGRAGGPRGGPPRAVHQQPQADRAGDAQLPQHQQFAPLGRWAVVDRVVGAHAAPPLHRAGADLQRDQLRRHRVHRPDPHAERQPGQYHGGVRGDRRVPLSLGPGPADQPRRPQQLHGQLRLGAELRLRRQLPTRRPGTGRPPGRSSTRRTASTPGRPGSAAARSTSRRSPTARATRPRSASGSRRSATISPTPPPPSTAGYRRHRSATPPAVANNRRGPRPSPITRSASRIRPCR